MIPVKMPNLEDYTDKEGTVDMNRYMGDYTKALVLGIQSSFLGGPLAAIQFDMIKHGLLDEQGAGIEQANKMQQATDIVTKLQTEFPILKSDSKLESLASRAIRGAKIEKMEQAKAEGKEYVDLTYADYEEIIVSILQNQPKTEKKPDEEKIEKMRGQPTLATEPGIKNEMQDIIAGMQSVGNTKKLF
jgi:hypothetical protein